MAYMSQENKKRIAELVKPILKKYKIKGSLSVDNHSTLVLSIKESPIDFIGSYNSVNSVKHPDRFNAAVGSLRVNEYWYKEHYDGVALAALQEIIPAMMSGNHNNSDIMSDYHDTGWYIEISVGRWNKPYVVSC